MVIWSKRTCSGWRGGGGSVCSASVRRAGAPLAWMTVSGPASTNMKSNVSAARAHARLEDACSRRRRTWSPGSLERCNLVWMRVVAFVSMVIVLLPEQDYNIT